MTFNELYESWFKIKLLEVRPGTLSLYKLNWKYLMPHIGERNISSFGQMDSRFLLAVMINDGLSPKTAKDRMAFIKQMLLFAARELEQQIKSLDWHLKYPEGKPREIKNFTESEMLRIVKAAYSEIESGKYTSLPVLISILTGMRLGEIIGLQWKDIDFIHNLINVKRNVTKVYDPQVGKERFFIGSPKTKAGFRDIPLLPILRRCLRYIGGKTPNLEHFVIGNSERNAIHNTIRDSYSRFLKRNKLPSINFHGLRHTYATLLVESGGDIKTISTLLGHSNVALTLNLYVHPSLESKRKVTNKAFRKLKNLSASE